MYSRLQTKMTKAMIKKNQPLYISLALLIVSTVLVATTFLTIYSYQTAKSTIINDIQENTENALLSLHKPISHYIDSYAINEYQQLILNKMADPNLYAITINDLNMAKIVGKKNYQIGVIRNSKNHPVAFGNDNKEQLKKLTNCFYKTDADLINTNDEKIGKLTICSSSDTLDSELHEILYRNLQTSLLISSALMLLLFFTIRKVLINPISDIMRSLNNTDDTGIPKEKLPETGSQEIVRLSSKINNMIDTTQAATQKLVQQQKALSSEKERFQLAIEGTQDGLWDWNIASGELYMSNQFALMLGYKPNELEQNIDTWTQLLHPEDREQVQAVIQDYFSSVGTKDYESLFRLRHKNGEWIWIRGRGKALFSKDNQPLRFLGFNSDITQQIEYEKKLDHTAKHDNLTNLPNRFLFNELIQNAMNQCHRSGKTLALLYVDLDGFKAINDSFSHQAGDYVLIKTAERMQKIIRNEDIIARLGGDEFVIGIINLEHQDDILPLVERLLTDLRQPIEYAVPKKTMLKVSASIGISFYPQENSLGSDALIRQADVAMYKAKSSGKNQFYFFDVTADKLARKHIQQIKHFEQAITRNELELFYQPKIKIGTNEITGFEALLRWQHPKQGILIPGDFLPRVQTEKNLMLKLSQWIFNEVFSALSAWQKKGLETNVSINITSHEFDQSYLTTTLNTLFKKYPSVKHEQIQLEILENTALDDLNQAQAMIKTAQKMGIKIALDDFGTGYSTLTYLKDLPVDIIKVDKSFIKDMLHDNSSFSILEATLGLAKAFRCQVIAEGVETIEQGKVLMQLGCDEAQGYAIAKPMPEKNVIEWIADFKGIREWKKS